MSKENHPNFYMLKFVSDIVISYHNSLRGNSKGINPIPDIEDLITDFVKKVEERVDLAVEEIIPK